MKKDKLIKHLKECGAIKFGRFVLTSGAISDYYIDIKKASTEPKTLKLIAQEMGAFTKGYDLLAGMELGAVPLVVAVSLETGIPYVIIRKEKRKHGTGKQIEGADVKGKSVLIIEDVTTSGGSVIKTIQILRENNAEVEKALAVVDRESGTKEKLKKLEVEFIPLIRVSEILKNKQLEKQ
ncbi:orotate phosphoribosyltransferase [Thermoplasmatales archaeon SM1-50]|nr:MAG: orotate phosphoribosyltransferase [Thermoplasmatales archaeon SM1-50]